VGMSSRPPGIVLAVHGGQNELLIQQHSSDREQASSVNP